MNSENTLLKKLSMLGLPLMETSEEFDVDQTLAEVVTSHDTRLWEGFPVLLMNAAKEYGFDCQRVLQYLTSNESKEAYSSLLALSTALYEVNHLHFLWANKLKKTFSPEQKSYVKELKSYLSRNDSFVCAGVEFNPDRLKNMFSLYFETDAERTQETAYKNDALALEYALSQFFSPKQKELFKKKLEGRHLTKTEKEYFSRSVKKKVVALANADLHRMAQKMMERS